MNKNTNRTDILHHGSIDALLDNVTNKDNFNHEVFIFDDINGVKLSDNPIILDMPVFAVCLQGEATVKLNLKNYPVSANSLVTFMPNHILHGYTSSPDFKGIFVAISKQFAQEILPDLHSMLPLIMSFKSMPVIKLSDTEAQSLHEFHTFLWKRIKCECGAYRRKVIMGLLQSVLYEVLSIYQEHYNYIVSRRSHNEDIFYNFVGLVERNFKHDRTVKYYADKMFITPKHLTTVIKQVSGRTASDWIDNFVILAAKVMLRSSSCTIQEVSADLNFPNQSFFGKYFKQRVGVSPSEFRGKS